MRKASFLASLSLLWSIVTLFVFPTTLLAEQTYASCWEIRSANPGAQDGVYSISPNGKTFQVYCSNMSSSPKEYLELMNTGGHYNFSTYAPGGASPGPGVKTSFAKIRLNPQTLKLDTGDFTFSTSEGYIIHGFTRTQIPYGVARGCTGYMVSPQGTANIDLRGTPFAVAPNQFYTDGFGPSGTVLYSDNGQVIQLTGDGYCGWTSPSEAGHDAPGGEFLQLEYKALSIQAVVSPSSSNGWHKTDVLVSYVCSSALGVIFTCPDPLLRTTEGFHETVQTVTYGVYSASASASFYIDKTAPVITLNGNSDITLSKNGLYIENGATATDLLAGNLSSAIAVEGTVDSTTPGTYPIRYAVQDLAGNKAEAIRTVRVAGDTEARLAAFTVSEGLLSAKTDGSGYSLTIPQSVNRIDANITTRSELASYTVTGVTYQADGSSVALTVPSGSGPFAFTITVTAEDGATKQSYTVDVARVPSLFGYAKADPDGLGLVVSFRMPLYSDGNEALQNLRLVTGDGVVPVIADWDYSDPAYSTVRLRWITPLAENAELYIGTTREGIRMRDGGYLSLASYPVLTSRHIAALKSALDTSTPKDGVHIDDIVKWLLLSTPDKDVTQDGVFDSYDVKVLLSLIHPS
ncbi:GON domain-containing protein [Paenibacillus mesophilus]|uniref:GON domain-containing protein n=1 Tax=Paenibacillus mesophilus TaxID=2582849 RepID=UPI0013050B1F|nr:GON domain-containing protein [Paenibacillus mesophilus]